MSHILLKNVVMRYRTKDMIVNGFNYNELKGVWDCPEGRSLVEQPEFLPAGSKKRDIETGEDQK